MAEGSDNLGSLYPNLYMRDGVVKTISNTWKEIYGLDRDIEELILRRNALVWDAIANTKAVSGIHNLIGVDPIELQTDYFKSGIGGATVRRAILGIRSLLFDDTKEAFRQFNCVEVSFGSNRVSDEYSINTHEFTFIDMSNVGHEFTVVIPTVDYDPFGTTMYYTPYKQSQCGPSFDEVDPELRFPDYCEKGKESAGNISVCIICDNTHHCICSSMDLDEVRRRIADVVYNYGWEIKTAMERQASMLNRYSPQGELYQFKDVV